MGVRKKVSLPIFQNTHRTTDCLTIYLQNKIYIIWWLCKIYHNFCKAIQLQRVFWSFSVTLKFTHRHNFPPHLANGPRLKPRDWESHMEIIPAVLDISVMCEGFVKEKIQTESYVNYSLKMNEKEDCKLLNLYTLWLRRPKGIQWRRKRDHDK